MKRPDAVIQRLQHRVKPHHRSLQGKLPATIKEEAVRSEPALSPSGLLDKVRRLGLHTSADAAAVIRTDRDRH